MWSLPKACLIHRWACIAVASQVGLWASTAAAQSAAPTRSSQADSPMALEAPAYEDKVIEDLPPAAPDEGSDYNYDRNGWPRYWRAESRWGSQPFANNGNARGALVLNGLLETPNHGVLSLDGAWLTRTNDDAPGTAKSSLTVRQRRLPLRGGGMADLEAGTGYPVNTDLNALPSRVAIPSSVQRGVQGVLNGPDERYQLLGSWGQPGQLQGAPAYGFLPQLGSRTGWGVQWRALPTQRGDEGDQIPTSSRFSRLPGWTFAWQAVQARGVDPIGGAINEGRASAMDDSGHLFAIRHESEKGYWQAKWLNNRSNVLPGSRNGLWLDSVWRSGPMSHSWGLYSLDKALSWGGQALASDMRGAYYRGSWHRRQWSLDGAFDWLQSVSGDASDGWYFALNGRRRLDSQNTISAGLAAREFRTRAWSSHLDWRFENAWGDAGLRWEHQNASDADGGSLNELSYDQDWSLPVGLSLSTSLGYQIRSATDRQARESAWKASTSAAGPIFARGSWRAGLDLERGNRGYQRQQVNLSARWQLAQRWHIEASYTRNTGEERITAVIDPLALPQTNDNRPLGPTDRTFLVVLAYEFQAGSRLLPIGGKVGSGGGEVSGVVFFDDNGSGKQEASEQGVGGIPVFLDNRYAVQTDAQGRFSFPLVGEGAHAVTVRDDTLPLPWRAAGDGQMSIDVQVRQTVQLNIGLVRDD